MPGKLKNGSAAYLLFAILNALLLFLPLTSNSQCAHYSLYGWATENGGTTGGAG